MPMQDWLLSREEAIKYAKECKVLPKTSSDSIFSIDENIWGRSCECGILEDLWAEVPENVYALTKQLNKNIIQDEENVEIKFENGVPISLNNERMLLDNMIIKLNTIAGKCGIGRIDSVENRLTGIKSREIYEAPAAMVLIKAHQELESLTLMRDVLLFKPLIENKFSNLLYDGFWHSPLNDAIMKFLKETQKNVAGTIKLKLYNGNIIVTGRKSDKSLYKFKLATYSSEDQFDHQSSQGFMKIWGMPLEIYSSVNRNKKL